MSTTKSQLTTGSYAVTTVYSMPWVGKKKQPNEPVVKKTRTKAVINHKFEEYAKISDDPFWISILNECSKGKFPRGFFYTNGLITYRKGNNTERLTIPEDPYDAYYSIKTFFNKKVCLMSKRDKEEMKKIEEENLAERLAKEFSWKTIKTIRVKELLVSEFVTDISRKLKFSKRERDELATTIKRGFILKCFSNDDIIMENGKIIKIHGLVKDKENKYKIDSRYMKEPPKNKIKGLGIEKSKNKSSVSFMTMWIKYLDSLDKRTKGLKLSESRSNISNISSSSSYE